MASEEKSVNANEKLSAGDTSDVSTNLTTSVASDGSEQETSMSSQKNDESEQNSSLKGTQNGDEKTNDVEEVWRKPSVPPESSKKTAPANKKNKSSLVSSSYRKLQMGLGRLSSETETVKKLKGEDSDKTEETTIITTTTTKNGIVCATKSSASSVSGSYHKLQLGQSSLPSTTQVDKEKAAAQSSKEEGKTSMDTSVKSKHSDSVSSADYKGRLDAIPDRSKSDYYCEICDSHMNSDLMWESHITGKRHLKNLKKEPGEAPTVAKTVKLTDRVPVIQRRINEVSEPVVGLDYISEIQKYDPTMNPTYNCYLCHSSLTMLTVIDHVLGTKHRMLYMKEKDPDGHALVEGMGLRKEALASIAEGRAAALEERHGRGTIEVKMEKEKPKSESKAKKRDYDEEDDYYRQAKRSFYGDRNMDDRSRFRSSSPQPFLSSSILPQQHPSQYNLDFINDLEMYPMNVKLRILTELSHPVIVSEAEEKVIMKVINSLTQALMQYKVKVMPPDLKDRLARQILQGDTRSLETILRDSNMMRSSFMDDNNFPSLDRERMGSPMRGPGSSMGEMSNRMNERYNMNRGESSIPGLGDFRSGLRNPNSMMESGNMSAAEKPITYPNLRNLRGPSEFSPMSGLPSSMSGMPPPMSGMPPPMSGVPPPAPGIPPPGAGVRTPMSSMATAGTSGNWRRFSGAPSGSNMGNMNVNAYERSNWKRGGRDDTSSFGY